ncbi:PspC domain-containing protein [Bacillus suaedaesalsae]|uniref:PspC domain-containing protein n=1 Tax=Bacillus suaedaesalsae TaxID=2810349 RepID=A0ABS2DKK0_9BACI|nr:PspC domain-containing protein [Bacillus suaedaesalsae]MBM6619029.1 PspC domain-containing protein [Bacillus suaedaesalsae]
MKKLYRSRKDRKISGSIGGLAEYTGIDAALLRILFVIGLLLSFGTFLIVYIVWMLVVPNEEDVLH